MQPSTFQFPLIKKETVANGVMSFYFDCSKEQRYEFLPGQYNRVIIPEVTNDPRGNSRMFSIASSPTSKDFFMITTKVSESPFKQYLAGLSTGQSVQFFGPIGRFVLDEKDTRPHVFLAGGIGLTPFHSMLGYAADKNLVTPFTLFVSFSTPEDMIYFDEFQTMSDTHPTIKTIYTLSHSESVPADWTGETGRINAEMINKYIPDYSGCVFYICGSQKVIEALEKVVIDMGVSGENIKKEQFVGY